MTKAKLTLMVVALSNFLLINTAARAADSDGTSPTPKTDSVPQENLLHAPAALKLSAPSVAISPQLSAPSRPDNPDASMGTGPSNQIAINPGGVHGIRPMGGMCPMIGHLRGPLAMLEGANALTDDQYEKLDDIKAQFITNVVPKGLNMYLLSRKMKDLLTAPDIDTKAVKDVEKQISSVTSDISTTAMDSIVSATQVLTPEQRKELHSKMIRASLGGSNHHDDQR